MSIFENILESVLNVLAQKPGKARFIQYKHNPNASHEQCTECEGYLNRIFERGTEPTVPIHLHCDCFYEDVETKAVGSVSVMGEDAPDVWLKKFGKLPDYYITKQEAIILGWDSSKNTVSGKAPGKMLGGDYFENKEHILPEKNGRVWFECDVDYFGGKRNSARLLYSNDGLIFYSPKHYSEKYYFVE